MMNPGLSPTIGGSLLPFLDADPDMPRLLLVLVANSVHPLLRAALRRHLVQLPDHAQARVVMVGAGVQARRMVEEVAPGLGRVVAEGWPLGLTLNQVMEEFQREGSLASSGGRVIFAPALSLPQPSFHATFAGPWARPGACYLSPVADLPMEARRRTADELVQWQPGADGGLRALQTRRRAWRKSRWRLWPGHWNPTRIAEPDAAWGCFAQDLFALNGCLPSARTLREVTCNLMNRLQRVSVKVRHLPPEALLWRINTDPAAEPPPMDDGGNRLWSPLLGIVRRGVDDLRMSYHGGEPVAAKTLKSSAGETRVPCELHLEVLGFGRRLPQPPRQVQLRVGMLVPGASPVVMHRERFLQPALDLLLTPRMLPTDLEGLARSVVMYDDALVPRPLAHDDAASYTRRHHNELRAVVFRALRMREVPELARISGQLPALHSDAEESGR
jgi:hypothetical protein